VNRHAEWRRLQYDWRVASRMQNEIVRITPFASVSGAKTGRILDARLADEGHATTYVAEYTFPMVTRHSSERASNNVVRLSGTRALIDLRVDASYPLSTPLVQILGTPRPFSPHVHPLTGTVCLGELWKESAGSMLVGELVVHVARILNFDERDPGASLDGFDVDGIRYWREVLKGQPLNRGLRYPVVPEHEGYGTARVLTRVTSPRVATRPALMRRAT
jgi:hypothetical protein